MHPLRNALRQSPVCVDCLDLAIIAREAGARPFMRHMARRAIYHARLVWRAYATPKTAA